MERGINRITAFKMENNSQCNHRSLCQKLQSILCLNILKVRTVTWSTAQSAGWAGESAHGYKLKHYVRRRDQAKIRLKMWFY